MGDITRCVILILPSQKNKTKKIEKNLDNYHLMRYNIKAVANAAIAQSVERILGKDEVASSNLASSSKEKPRVVKTLGFFASLGLVNVKIKTKTKTKTFY